MDKTENATPRRKQQAREKGQIAKSTDLAAVLTLLAGFFFLSLYGNSIGGAILEFSQNLFRGPWITADPDQILQYLSSSVFHFLGRLAGLFIVLFLLGIGAHFMQTGWIFLPNKVFPDFQRISLFEGFGRIFSLDSLFRTGFGMIKIFLCSAFLAISLYLDWGDLQTLGQRSMPELVSALFQFLVNLGFRICGGLLLLSVFDLLWQHWKLNRDLKMTPEEIREEMKEVLGDPQILQKRKELQQTVNNRF